MLWKRITHTCFCFLVMNLILIGIWRQRDTFKHLRSARHGLCAPVRRTYNSIVPSHVSDNPLIVVAGMGTTGTRWLSQQIYELGYEIGHWKTMYTSNETLKTYWRDDLWKSLMTFRLKHNATFIQSFDFTVLDHVDGVSDTPIQYMLPWLLRSYPNARVILSERDTFSWAQSRLRKHKYASLYYNSLFLKRNGLADETPNVQDFSMSFDLYNMFVRCCVDNLLRINVFEEDQKVVKKRLKRFLEHAAET